MENKTLNTTVKGLTDNYLTTITNIITNIKDNGYVLKINGGEVPNNNLNDIEINFYNLTRSARKKLSKRLWNYEKKGTIKTMNYLFHVLKKMELINDKIIVDVSHEEARIQLARKLYVKFRTEAEAARIAYKEVKGDFYI